MPCWLAPVGVGPASQPASHGTRGRFMSGAPREKKAGTGGCRADPRLELRLARSRPARRPGAPTLRLLCLLCRLRGDFILDNCRRWVAWCKEKGQGGERGGAAASAQAQQADSERFRTADQQAWCDSHSIIFRQRFSAAVAPGWATPLESADVVVRTVCLPQGTGGKWSSSCLRWRRN